MQINDSRRKYGQPRSCVQKMMQKIVTINPLQIKQNNKNEITKNRTEYGQEEKEDISVHPNKIKQPATMMYTKHKIQIKQDRHCRYRRPEYICNYIKIMS